MSHLSWMWKNQSLIFHIISSNQCICLYNLSLNSLFNLFFLSKPPQQKHIKRKPSQISTSAFLSVGQRLPSPTKSHPNQPTLHRLFVHPLPISIQLHRICLAMDWGWQKIRHQRRVPAKTNGRKTWVDFWTIQKVCIKNIYPHVCMQKKSMEASRYTVLHMDRWCDLHPKIFFYKSVSICLESSPAPCLHGIFC